MSVQQTNRITTETALAHFENSPIWGYHLPISIDVANQLIEEKDRRVILTIGGERLHVAIMPKQLECFIMLNKALVKKLNLQLGQKVQITLEKDPSEYGMEMPDELRELLFQDDEGSSYFHALTPGKQRNLIYLVSKVKSTDSRLKKALAIVHHLKEMQGKLDFKMLNETIKYYNQL
ncbi:MAG: YdeI/OmpD-associated family protein [Bacteroidota bacterium]